MNNSMMPEITLRPERACDLMPERVFADLWEEMNRTQRGINHGHALLEFILNTQPIPPGPWDQDVKLDPVSERDKQVAQAVIQWLGTRAGVCFLVEADRRIRLATNEAMFVYHETYNLGLRCHECKGLKDDPQWVDDGSGFGSMACPNAFHK